MVGLRLVRWLDRGWKEMDVELLLKSGVPGKGFVRGLRPVEGYLRFLEIQSAR